MIHRKYRFITLLLGVFMFSAGSSAATLEEALQAYDLGDYATFLHTLRPLANAHNSEAEFLLGVVYDNGYGVAKDYMEAARWYRKAAVQGHVQAQFNLATLYDLGQGVPQDSSEAAKWYKAAAEQGDSQAQNNLGIMYFLGQGVSRDPVKAYAWALTAGTQGQPDALDNARLIEEKLSPQEQEEGKKLFWSYYGQYVYSLSEL
jgi:hypothetical protein